MDLWMLYRFVAETELPSVKATEKKKNYISINNFLDGYKELILCLCSLQCIRDLMMQRMQVSKGI